MFRSVILLVTMCHVIGCTPQTPPPPSLMVITTEGDQTKVVMQLAEDTAVFDITSPNGIGGANIQLSSGEWQPTVILRFHLSGLEEMALTYGQTATSAASSASVTLNISSTDSQVYQSANSEPITSDSPYWLTVSLQNEDGSAGQIPLENGVIEVTLPRDFHTQNPASFHISWIDFYR